MKKVRCLLLLLLCLIFFAVQSSLAVSLEDFPCVLNIFKSQDVSSKINVGLIPIDIAVNSKTNKIYVSNFGDNTVSIINGGDNSIISTISIGNAPYGISINEDTNKIYIANQNDNSVSIIDGLTNTLINTITVESRPIQITVNSNTNKIYVVNQDSNTVSVIDGSTDAAINSISVGEVPFGIEVNKKTNKIYVANSLSNTISVIDGQTETVIKTIENLNESPYGIAIDEKNNIVYAFSLKGEELLGRGFLFKINGSTDSIIENYIIGSNGTDIALHPKTEKIYVTHTFNGIIDGYNINKNQLICLITNVDSPSGIAINTETNFIYVCNNDLSSITVLKDNEIKDNNNKEPEPEKPKDNPPVNENNNNEEINTELKDELNLAFTDLETIQNDLLEESRFAKPITARIGFFINKLKRAISAPSERCNQLLEVTIPRLETITPMLEKRSCAETQSRRCIPEEAVIDFSSSIEEQIEVIILVAETDDNENHIADVCEKNN